MSVRPAEAPHAPQRVILVARFAERPPGFPEVRARGLPLLALGGDDAERVEIRHLPRVPVHPMERERLLCGPLRSVSIPSMTRVPRGPSTPWLEPTTDVAPRPEPTRPVAGTPEHALAPRRTTRGRRPSEVHVLPRPWLRRDPSRRGCRRAPPRSDRSTPPVRRAASRIRCGSASSASARKCSAWRHLTSSASPEASVPLAREPAHRLVHPVAKMVRRTRPSPRATRACPGRRP